MKLMILHGVMAVVLLSGLAHAQDAWDPANETLTYTCSKNEGSNATSFTIQYGPTRSSYYVNHNTASVSSLNGSPPCSLQSQYFNTSTDVSVSNASCGGFQNTDYEEFEVTYHPSGAGLQNSRAIRFQFACNFSEPVTAEFDVKGITAATSAVNGTANQGVRDVSAIVTVFPSEPGPPVLALTLDDTTYYKLIIGVNFKSSGLGSFRLVYFRISTASGSKTESLAEKGCKLSPDAALWKNSDKSLGTSFGTTSANSAEFKAVKFPGNDNSLTLIVGVELCVGSVCPALPCAERKRRSATDDVDKPELQREFSVTVNLVDERNPVTSNTIEGKKDDPESRVVPCWQSTEFIAIVAVLVFLLLVSISISCFSVIRARTLYVNNKPV